MRHIVLLLVVLTILVLAIAGMETVAGVNVVSAQFNTNTPQPSPIVFATNTPVGPTHTPTYTPTATDTPTSTYTATYTPTATFTPTNTPSPTPTPNGPFVYPEGVNPLTGLPYPNEEAMNRRNLIVKISNYPPVVRPQTGINLADVVFEFEAEGGVTRFAAIFRSNAPEKVGSVRSSRLADLEMVVMYNALFAYSGTSEPIQQMILAADWVFQAFSPLKGDNENAGFYRDQTLLDDPDVDLEHTMFLNTQKLYELATERNVNIGLQARGFAFSEEPLPGGAPINDIFVDWYGQTDARWQYDEESGHYLRYTDSVPHYDKGDGQQLWVDNVVVIEVPHVERPDLFPPGSNYESIGIELWDQGRAYVFRDGVFYQGFWRRDERQRPGDALQLIFGNNAPITLHPGRTWVEVVRWFGDVTPSETKADMSATATAIAQENSAG